jgi:hypothetical protein
MVQRMACAVPGFDNPSFGAGAPTAATIGNTYVDTTANHLYQRDAAGAWHDVGAFTAVKGDKGDTGPAGPQGAASTVPGPTGATGPAGPVGPAGPTGARGPIGAVGPVSTTPGPPGPQGGPGAIGPRGPAGADGKDGARGVPGVPGNDSFVAGPAGPPGQDGPQGLVGPQGDPGPIGPDGLPGQPGADGATIAKVEVRPSPVHKQGLISWDIVIDLTNGQRFPGTLQIPRPPKFHGVRSGFPLPNTVVQGDTMVLEAPTTGVRQLLVFAVDHTKLPAWVAMSEAVPVGTQPITAGATP